MFPAAPPSAITTFPGISAPVAAAPPSPKAEIILRRECSKTLAQRPFLSPLLLF